MGVATTKIHPQVINNAHPVSFLGNHMPCFSLIGHLISSWQFKQPPVWVSYDKTNLTVNDAHSGTWRLYAKFEPVGPTVWQLKGLSYVHHTQAEFHFKIDRCICFKKKKKKEVKYCPPYGQRIRLHLQHLVNHKFIITDTHNDRFIV